jgi:hypothetical protein
VSVDQWTMRRILQRAWRTLIAVIVTLLAVLVARYAGMPLPYGQVVGLSYHVVLAGSAVACLLGGGVTRRERWAWGQVLP